MRTNEENIDNVTCATSWLVNEKVVVVTDTLENAIALYRKNYFSEVTAIKKMPETIISPKTNLRFLRQKYQEILKKKNHEDELTVYNPSSPFDMIF